MPETPPPPPSPPPREGPSPTDLWLMGRFGEYYRRHPPELPDRFGRREYGYLFFGAKFMLRHVGFKTRADFETFHERRAPAHSYYSTAYYDKPDAPTMKEKGWKAAELIFDLDADHVPGAEKLPYAAQLDRVKMFFTRLVDEFLVRDFGFGEKDLVLTFSGGRGYHAHVKAERALELTSQERREIVDYVTGTGLELDRHIRVATKARSREVGAKGFQTKTLRVSAHDDPGWGGRLNRGVVAYLEKIRAMNIQQLTEEARAFKHGQKELTDVGRHKLAAELWTELQKLDEGKLQRIREGAADQGNLLKKILPPVFHEQIIPLAKGETDEPVTSDTKRLIRTPGSLHGKSGMKVVTLTRDQLDAFDPLVDAVVFTDDPVTVEVKKPMEVALKRQALKLEVGRQRLPEWAAVFALMRGAAVPRDT